MKQAERARVLTPCGGWVNVGPDWALSVLDGVSSVLSSSVVWCRLQCDWLQLDWRCDSSVGSVASKYQECVALMFCFCDEQHGPKQHLMGRDFLKMWWYQYASEMEWCILWCASPFSVDNGTSMCLSLVSHFRKGWEEGKRGEGPSVAQCPKLPNTLQSVFMALVQEWRDEEWVVYQSYFVVL